MAETDPYRWPRTIFVVLHVLAISILAVPTPSGARAAGVWEDPSTLHQLAGWTPAFRALGLADSTPAVRDLLRGLAIHYLDVRDAVTDPLKPYTNTFGTGQIWQMFATLNDEPARIQVSLKRPGGDWQPIYRARDPELRWRADFFDEERVRAIANEWSWMRGKTAFQAFAHWVCARAREDFPDASACRMSQLKGQLPSPAQLRAHDWPLEAEVWPVDIVFSPEGT